jgi:TPR repeat protein
MAETGFCYAQGIGCKKNLKKSAKYYRMAEAKGMSMIGNSWYVYHRWPRSISPPSVTYTMGTQDS